MRHDLAFLHTAAIQVESFAVLCEEIAPSLRIRHAVDESLLAAARESGITASLAEKVHGAVIDAASTGAAVVVCTCSSLGGLAEGTNTAGKFVAMRVDRAMADAAVLAGERILVVAALASTLGPTCSVLESSARNAHTRISLAESLVEDAWTFFASGNRDRYHELVEGAVRKGLDAADVIVLAQASMAPVATRFLNAPVPVLSSPRLGVTAAVNLLAKERAAGHSF